MKWPMVVFILVCFAYATIMTVLGVDFWIILLSAVPFALAFQVLITLRDRRIANILDEQCDPELFLEKCGKFSVLHREYCIALGYACMGRFGDAINALTGVDTPSKVRQLLDFMETTHVTNKIMKLCCHALLMGCYTETGDMEKAAAEYEKVKELRKSAVVHGAGFGIDIIVLEFHYKQNMTAETAKFCLEQVRYLYGINPKKLSKRQRLAAWFIEAELLEKLGDIEAASEKYRQVAENGNKLHIAELSRGKLAELGGLIKGMEVN